MGKKNKKNKKNTDYQKFTYIYLLLDYSFPIIFRT